jgi:hypothetical protein
VAKRSYNKLVLQRLGLLRRLTRFSFLMAARQMRARVLALAATVFVAAAPAAHAATIGDSSFAPSGGTNGSASYFNSAAPASGYTIPSDGSLTSWSTRAFAGNTQTQAVRAIVFRTVDVNRVQVVGRSDVLALPNTAGVPPATPRTGTFPSPLPVQAGDILGIEITGPPSGNAFVMRAGQAATYETKIVNGSPAVGVPAATSPGGTGSFSGWQVNVAAEFAPGPVGPPPTCSLTAVRKALPGGFDQADATVKATAGLKSITPPVVVNGAATVPTFTPGTTAPVVVTVTKATQGILTRFWFNAVDTANRSTFCA